MQFSFLSCPPMFLLVAFFGQNETYSFICSLPPTSLSGNYKATFLRLDCVEETANLVPVTFKGDFIMGVPLIFFASSKWKGRGKALFDSKTDNLDGLDEIISQWLDAVRDGRIKRYIPEDLCPRDPETACGTFRISGSLWRDMPYSYEPRRES